ncbi:MAG: hypothetical protein VX569_11120 [Pseudomonadota bacterium]|nr:hypothetical protein [Pseudomonadota bacterium]
MHKITNLTNSPQDLEGTEGTVRLPAMGSVTAEFTPAYIEALRGAGLYEVEEVDAEARARDRGYDTPAKDDIASAIALLDPTNDDHWTVAGLPEVAAVKDALGVSVTRKQIEEAAPEARRPV